MKRHYLLPPLALAAMLLTGCPDTVKLPTPPPNVPAPKAENTVHHGPAAPVALNLNITRVPATRPS
jgi:uncharacterized lipoprotein YbaY